MYCSNCGKEIDDNAKFCQFCGNQVNKSETLNDVEKQAMKKHYRSHLENIKKQIKIINILFTSFKINKITVDMPDSEEKVVYIVGDIVEKNKILNNKTKYTVILEVVKGIFKTQKYESSMNYENDTFTIQVPYEEIKQSHLMRLIVTPIKRKSNEQNKMEGIYNQEKSKYSNISKGFLGFFGWYFGIGFICISILSLMSTNYIEGLLLCLLGLLCVPPINKNLDSLLKERTDKKKIKIITAIILVLLALLIPPTNNNDNAESITNTKKSESAIKNDIKMFDKTSDQQKVRKAPIEDGALYKIPESYGQGYDKTIKKHGMANIKKSNLLLPKAANLVAQNESCDTITNVMLSDNRSTSSNLVIITDCKNGQRFYLSEKEIISNTVVQSEKDKLIKLLPTHVSMCEARIKNELNYPSTYKKLISKTGFETDDMVNDIVVGFKAKNAFNLELEYQARCMLNSKNDFSIFNIKEVK